MQTDDEVQMCRRVSRDVAVQTLKLDRSSFVALVKSQGRRRKLQPISYTSSSEQEDVDETHSDTSGTPLVVAYNTRRKSVRNRKRNTRVVRRKVAKVAPEVEENVEPIDIDNEENEADLDSNNEENVEMHELFLQVDEESPASLGMIGIQKVQPVVQQKEQQTIDETVQHSEESALDTMLNKQLQAFAITMKVNSDEKTPQKLSKEVTTPQTSRVTSRWNQ